MLYVIQDKNDPYLWVVKDDPVRPEIPVEFRVGAHTEIFLLLEDQQPLAAVCCAYKTQIPKNVFELSEFTDDPAAVAVFYTIWSYRPGAGRELIVAARSWIETHRPNIAKFVTLSPPTEMARRFHLKNGARVLQINSDTVNYIYGE